MPNTNQIRDFAFDHFCESQGIEQEDREFFLSQAFAKRKVEGGYVWQVLIQIEQVDAAIATWFVKVLESNRQLEIDPDYDFDSILEVGDGYYQNEDLPESLRELIDKWVALLSEVDVEEAPATETYSPHPLLPAWFTDEMMKQPYYYALITGSGQAILISSIQDINSASDGSLWIDVAMLRLHPRDTKTLLLHLDRDLLPVYAIPTDDPTNANNLMTVSASHIVAAMRLQGELVD